MGIGAYTYMWTSKARTSFWTFFVRLEETWIVFILAKKARSLQLAHNQQPQHTTICFHLFIFYIISNGLDGSDSHEK